MGCEDTGPDYRQQQEREEQELYERNLTTEENKMAIVASKSGGNFEMTPEGVHVARCYRIIDIGTQKSEYQGQVKHLRKVMIAWELLGDDRMSDGRPFSINKRYTLSLHEKAQLRKDLEAWRGKAFTPEEEAGFDISKVLGAYCMVNIVHEKGGNGNDYANIASIMPLPKGMPKPEPVNETSLFEIESPNMVMFEAFSDKLKAIIQAAPEWNAKKSSTPLPSGGGGFDDDIPFDSYGKRSVV